MNELRVIYEIMMRELKILRQNHIYRFCMVLFPVLVIFFFTSIMDDGLPADMPVGVVDLDKSMVSCIFPRAPQRSCWQAANPRFHITILTRRWQRARW